MHGVWLRLGVHARGNQVVKFWMRWFGGKDGDPRPISYPIPLEWWCTGTDGDGDVCTICALVEAVDEPAAWASARRYWPELREDSAEQVAPDWRPPAGRFPPKKGRR